MQAWLQEARIKPAGAGGVNTPASKKLLFYQWLIMD
jgi:hypothetical protein